ncbi:hypothetical protein, partial [Psychromonas sp.]|uniref:hypothetical protein n=1 Tax=Psychromonas sp. TaxID=1884585 RepID=UPI003567A7AF
QQKSHEGAKTYERPEVAPQLEPVYKPASNFVCNFFLTYGGSPYKTLGAIDLLHAFLQQFVRAGSTDLHHIMTKTVLRHKRD